MPGMTDKKSVSARKVAQRGVVKLFNAIQQAQMGAKEKEEEVKALRGSGKE